MGGYISGSVTEVGGPAIQDIHVNIHNTAGVLVTWEPTDSSGQYTTTWALPPGEYFVDTWNDLGYVNEVYDDTFCLGCDVTLGKKVYVTSGATTTDIDFDLVEGRTDLGQTDRSRDRSRNPEGSGSMSTRRGRHGDSGISARGEPVTTSPRPACPRAATSSATSTMWGAGPRYINEIYDDLPCPGPCDVTTGAACRR